MWNSARNTTVGQTALQAASGAALAVGASLKYEAAVTTPFDVAAGTIYVGFTRNPTGGMQSGFDNTGSCYDDDGSSNPSGMSGESSHSSRRMGAYIVYEVGKATYVLRSGASGPRPMQSRSGVRARGRMPVWMSTSGPARSG